MFAFFPGCCYHEFVFFSWMSFSKLVKINEICLDIFSQCHQKWNEETTTKKLFEKLWFIELTELINVYASGILYCVDQISLFANTSVLYVRVFLLSYTFSFICFADSSFRFRIYNSLKLWFPFSKHIRI